MAVQHCPTLVLLSVVLCTAAFGSEPTFDDVDYSMPSKYLGIPASLGNPAEIKLQAHELKKEDDRDTVLSVLNWMDANLRYDPDCAYEWRNYETAIKEGCYGGCADQSIVCGALLKGAGIPSIWVKTMDVAWIWDFKRKRAFKAWSGHVFLEVYIDGDWVLLDPGAKKIYTEYSPKARILPGNRFAYHKGDDPKSMVMSLQWENWKRQTASYFAQLDASLLPVDQRSAQDLGTKCFIIGNSPYYQALADIASRQGLTIAISFNTDYGNYLPQAKGHVLMVETHNDVPIIDTQVLDQYFPGAAGGLRSGQIAIDDTKIVFIDFDKLLPAALD